MRRKLYAASARPSRSFVGMRIKERRLERGLALKQLAVAAGLSDSFLSQVEHGQTYPTLPNFLDIADALDVDPADLLHN